MGYSPTLGRFLEEDPEGYNSDGMNLYQMERSNPLAFVDPKGTAAVPTAQPSTQPTTQPSGPPAVYVVDAYIKGDPIWGTCPCHRYFLIDGVGYGKYADSHIGGPPDSSGGIGVIGTVGRVVSGDEGKYPPTTNPSTLPPGAPYGVVRPIDEGVDKAELKKIVLHDLNKPCEYGAGTDDCFKYCDKVIQDSSKMGWLDRILKLPGP